MKSTKLRILDHCLLNKIANSLDLGDFRKIIYISSFLQELILNTE